MDRASWKRVAWEFKRGNTATRIYASYCNSRRRRRLRPFPAIALLLPGEVDNTLDGTAHLGDDRCQDGLHSAIPAISRARRPYINDNARPAKRRGSPGLERRRESARTCTHAHVCTARAYRRAHSHANTHPHVLRSFRLRHRRVFVLPSLRHENAHAVSYMQRDLRDRVRSIAASTGKWHLNPSIISHVIPLPG